MRVLVASTGERDTSGPLVPVIEAFAERGDELLLVVPPQLEARAASLGHALNVAGAPPARELAAIRARLATGPPHEAAIAANRDLFGRLWTGALLPAAERACREWGRRAGVRLAAHLGRARAENSDTRRWYGCSPGATASQPGQAAALLVLLRAVHRGGRARCTERLMAVRRRWVGHRPAVSRRDPRGAAGPQSLVDACSARPAWDTEARTMRSRFSSDGAPPRQKHHPAQRDAVRAGRTRRR